MEKKAVSKKKLSSDGSDVDLSPSWDYIDVITEHLELERWAVKNTVKLLDEENSIPFIARYRKEQTNNMEADKIRELNDKYSELK